MVSNLEIILGAVVIGRFVGADVTGRPIGADITGRFLVAEVIRWLVDAGATRKLVGVDVAERLVVRSDATERGVGVLPNVVSLEAHSGSNLTMGRGDAWSDLGLPGAVQSSSGSCLTVTSPTSMVCSFQRRSAQTKTWILRIR